MNKKLNYYLVKIDRIAAWVLLVSILVYFVSGFGMTKGIIDVGLATKLHNNILPLVAITAFTVHTFYAIRLTFKRWKIWDNFGKWLLIFAYTFFVSSFLYVGFFYKKPIKEASNTTNQTKQTTTPSVNQTINPSSNPDNGATTGVDSGKTLTATELAKYNGQNGQPAYVAVDGVVYDLSSIFQNGSHFSHLAGQELTSSFYSYHAKNQITKYPVVGMLK